MKNELWLYQTWQFWKQSAGYVLFLAVAAMIFTPGLLNYLGRPRGAEVLGVAVALAVLGVFYHLLKANRPVSRFWYSTPVERVFSFAAEWGEGSGYVVAERTEKRLRMRPLRIIETYRRHGRGESPPPSYDIVLEAKEEETTHLVGPARDAEALFARLEELRQEEYEGAPAPAEIWQAEAGEEGAARELPAGQGEEVPRRVSLFDAPPPEPVERPRGRSARGQGGGHHS